MKIGFIVTVVIVIWVLVFGSPVAGERPQLDHYYGSPDPILPMTFAHIDHTTVGCIDCHHNYVDDTGGSQCMYCHVTNEEVWPLLESQFHDLCRGCHEEKSALGEVGGPPRQCDGCHHVENAP